MSQSKSALLRMPLEIQHNIYSYVLPTEVHICARDRKLYISKCLEPDQDMRSSNFAQDTNVETYDGSERAPGWDDFSEEKWAHRLRSSWGPHWMCEEMVRSGAVMDNALLLVCKTMYIAVLDLFSRNIVTNVTDLDTLGILTENIAMEDAALLHSIPSMLRKNTSRLSITLRLPLDFFQSLETQEDPGNAQSWRRICSTQSLRTLTTLTLWLDHTSTSTWSLVNERLLLQPLLDMLLSSRVQVVIILPKLHPIHECADRHFLAKRIGKTAYIYRKLRQRYRSKDDCLVVVQVPDFPYFLDVREGSSMAEVEAYERAGWENGQDMAAFAEMERVPMHGIGNI